MVVAIFKSTLALSYFMVKWIYLLCLFSVSPNSDYMINFQRIDCLEDGSIKLAAFPKSGQFEATGKAHQVLDVFLRDEYFVNKPEDFIRVFEGDIIDVCLDLKVNLRGPISSKDVLSEFVSIVDCRLDSFVTQASSQVFVHQSIIERRKRLKHLKYPMNLVFWDPNNLHAIFVMGLAESPEMWEEYMEFKEYSRSDNESIDALKESFYQNGYVLEEKTLKVKDIYLRKAR